MFCIFQLHFSTQLFAVDSERSAEGTPTYCMFV